MIGSIIKELRVEKNINQSELGKLIGVGKTTISNYETGYSSPDQETLIKIADFFNVSVDYLLNRSDDYNLQSLIPETSLTDNERELLLLFRQVKNEREQIKLLGKMEILIDSIKEKNFKTKDVRSTSLVKNAG